MKNTKTLIATSEISAALSLKSLSGIRINSVSFSCGVIIRIPALNHLNSLKNITQKLNRVTA